MTRQEALSEAISHSRMFNDISLIWYDGATWRLECYLNKKEYDISHYETLRYILPNGEVTKLS